MKTLLMLMGCCLMLNAQVHLIDFGEKKDGPNWTVINDGVMGGLSQGQMTLQEDALFFKGVISLKNNGGFSSCKGPFVRTDLSKAKKVRMRLKSNGVRFAMTLEMSRQFFLPYYKKEFQTKTDDWEIIEFDMADFFLYRMGQNMGRELNRDDLSKILRIGIITSEKKEVPFQLEIDSIEFL
ncbi:MAG: CIA30 family protein [Calditrichota bacterium]